MPRKRWTHVASFGSSRVAAAAALLVSVAFVGTFAATARIVEVAELTWCVDRDGDGYGDPRTLVVQRDEPESLAGIRYVNDCGDCDDTDEGFHPAEAGTDFAEWPSRACKIDAEREACVAGVQFCDARGEATPCVARAPDCN